MKTNVMGFFGLIIMFYGFSLSITASDYRTYKATDTIPFGWGQTITFDAPVVASFVGCEYFLASNTFGTVIEGVAQSKDDIPLGWPCRERYIMENVSLPKGTFKTYEGDNTTAKIVSENPLLVVAAQTANLPIRMLVGIFVLITGSFLIMPWIDKELFRI